MRVYLLALLIASTALLNNGCWDQRPISELAIVLGLGIDLVDFAEAGKDSQILVTVELAHPLTEGTEGQPTLLSASGRNIQEAVRNLQQSLNLRLHWSHLDTLLISNAAARAGIDSYLNLFFHNHEMPEAIYIVICAGNAKDTLHGNLGLANYVASGIRELLRNQHGFTNGYIHPVRITDYRAAFALPGSGLLLPVVAFLPTQLAQGSANHNPAAAEQVEDDESNNNAMEAVHTNQEQSANGVLVADSDFLYLQGMAIIDSNQRYIGQLAGYQNSGANLWLNRLNNFVVLVECIITQQWLTIEINHWQRRLDWQIDPQNEQIRLFVPANAQGYLGGRPETSPYQDAYLLSQLEYLVAQELQRQLQAAWQQVINYQSDFLQLGHDLWRFHYTDWQRLAEHWSDILTTVKVEFQIDTQIQLGI